MAPLLEAGNRTVLVLARQPFYMFVYQALGDVDTVSRESFQAVGRVSAGSGHTLQ